MRVMIAAVLLMLPFVALAQSATDAPYCKALVASYRKAVAEGGAPVAGIGEAIVGCQTNPGRSIPPLEKALKDMKVELPSRT
jgi:hypothetical protein